MPGTIRRLPPYRCGHAKKRASSFVVVVVKLLSGTDDAAAPLSDAYAELRAAIATITRERDVDTPAEVRWAARHGRVVLDRDGRLRHDHQAERLDLLVDRLRP